MKFSISTFISTILLMLVTGVFWGTWFTLTQSLNSFQPGEFLHIGKVIIANVAWPMRIMMPLCILCMFMALWFYPNKRSSGFYFGIAAFILILITLSITLLVLVPIDNEIKTWTISTVPVNFDATRDRWEFYHAVRTFTSVSSFICFVLSVFISGRSLAQESPY